MNSPKCSTLPANAASRSVALDACRGIAVIAVIAVIAYHMSEFGVFPLLQAPFTLWPAFGMFGVDLFYVLSGFFITQSILSPTTWQPSAFVYARVTRIYPAYLCSLLIALGVKIFNGQAVDSYLVTNGLLHVFMLHNFLGLGGSLNGVYWTLGVEFPYYLLMLALAPFLRNERTFWYVTLGMLMIAILWRSGVFLYLPEGNRVVAGTQLPGSIDAFALGGMTAMLNRKKPLNQVLTQWRWAIFALSLVCLGLSLRQYSHHAGNYWSDNVSAIFWRSFFATSCAILILASAKMRYSKVLDYTGFPWFGKISFSLYLYHLFPILFVTRYLTDEPWQTKLFLSALLILIVSWASWRFVEKRFHRSAVDSTFPVNIRQ